MNEQGQRDILITFARLFRRFKVPYLLTGSFAVSSYGYPRATHDIDFVLEIEESAKKQLIRAISSLPSTYVQDITELNTERLTFYTIYHTETTTKVDLWFIADHEFEANVKRKRYLTIDELEIPLVSPEDLILKKLEWCKEVMSERHMRDCVGMWKVQKGKLDEAYLFEQAKTLGVEKLLKEVIETKDY
jgi:hypothetical protein